MTSVAPKPQRRGRAIAMSDEEIDDFLAGTRTCRVATTGVSGPHLSALWFVWVDRELWLYSLVRSQRWTDIERNPQLAILVDDGESYAELRGLEIIGVAHAVGDVPRTGAPDDVLATVERRFGQKYMDTDSVTYDGRHAWLRVQPTKLTSWDFRKLPAARKQP